MPVRLAIDVVEGPATMVRAVTFQGESAFTEAALGALIEVRPGDPFHVPRPRAAAAAILLDYLNEGYEAAQVDIEPRFDESGETADVAFRVRERPQAAGLERHLHRLQGNARLASRAMREAVLERNREGPTA